MPQNIETRAEQNDDLGLTSATAVVEELRSSVDSFRTEHEQRQQQLQERLEAVETRLNRPAIQTRDNRQDADDLEQRAFRNYLRHGREGMQADEIRALTAGTDAEGGATVPPTFVAELIKDLTEISPMRQLARVTNIGGTPALLPRRTGTPTGAWEGETTEAGETSSSYDQWSIPAHEARVYTDVSNRLLEDSALNVESEIRADLAEAFAELEGDAFFVGNGTGKPLGLLADPAFVTEEASGAAVTGDDLIDLFYSVKARYRNNGTWAMNSRTIAAVRKLKNTGGDYLWQDSLAAGQPPTLLGRPVAEVPVMDDIEAGAVPLMFGDFQRGYRIMQRLGMVVLPDRYTQAAKSIVRFHARMRVGGKLVLPEAVTGLAMPE